MIFSGRDLHTDGSAEKGGAAALASPSSTTDATFTTLGLRASTQINLGSMTATARGTSADAMPTTMRRKPSSPSTARIPSPSPRRSRGTQH
ncbi:autotransporter domain-containing protein [Mesorhizobium huakuii]|uniref:autotransporter domain-containing protein n=1 Tax=Mesorhizobium huakuii TaxID=28104 RepID=UPI00389963E3